MIRFFKQFLSHCCRGNMDRMCYKMADLTLISNHRYNLFKVISRKMFQESGLIVHPHFVPEN